MSSHGGRSGEALVLFAKAPIVGQVKTRLHAALGAEGATELYRAFLQDTLETMARVRRRRPSVETILSPPAGPRDFEGIDLRGATVLPQLATGDLGARLEHCFGALFAAGYASVVVIGADSPTLPEAYITGAFERLDPGADRLVLGPSSDGGYYLIGMGRLHAAVLRDIPWSSPTVLESTLAAARASAIMPELLPEWYDVDTPAELARLRYELSETPHAARDTARILLTRKR